MAVQRTGLAMRFLLILANFLVGAWSLPAETDDNVPRKGAVACENAICSRIGTNLLEDGGSAVDAIVGTVFCVGVVSMYHSGIGGGGFMLVRSSKGEYEFIDFRETAPAAAFETMFSNNTDGSIYGGLASGVPGEIRGLEYAHKRYGKLPWAHVMGPAIRVAREGFSVNEDLVRYMGKASPNEFLTEDPAWAIDFAPRGRRVQLGEIMTRKRYANTLEAIAEHGADAFYTGAIAKSTIAALQRANGTMTLEDLKNYTVAIRDPLAIDYRGIKLTSTSAPTSGAVALSALNVLSGYEGLGDPAQVNISTHRIDEAIRFGYGQRALLGDPSFVDGMAEYTKYMIAPETAAQNRAGISDVTSHDVKFYNPKGLESLETPGTSHLVSADASGLTVSTTTTVNLFFGSHVMVPETGIVMNNQMSDFSLSGVSNPFGYAPSPANFVRPGKRPLSSISPIIAEYPDGKLFFSIGSAGGSHITTATIQNAVHLLDGKMTISEALAQPRLHDQLIPDQVAFEYEFNNETVAFMKSLHHNVVWVEKGLSTAQGLRQLPNGTFEAAGEPRQIASGGFAV